jgi:cobalt transporter subunit CbtB
MTTATQTQVLGGSRTKVLSALFVALMGFGLIGVAGHVQASALHDAAHDVRHATGFPCH